MSGPASALQRIDVREVTGGLREHLPRPDLALDGPRDAVEAIIARVASGGDRAVLDLTEELDGVRLERSLVDADALAAAAARIDRGLLESLEVAARRITAYHVAQMPPATDFDDGVSIRSTHRPVAAAGCYVPGGRAAYPSTLLMTTIPARVAGVERVTVCCPPDRDTGAIADVTLAAASLAGVDEIHAVGGAQAIAAMAVGTESIAAVDVICGPGNRYVAIAQRLVAGRVGVPASFAGPSEIVVVADHRADPRLAAVDLVVQAEHGPDGLAWFVTWDDAVADAVEAEVHRLAATLPRAADIAATLAAAGRMVVVRDLAQALEVSDLVAPEHLQLMIADARSAAERVRNAGAVFLGDHSPAAAGDYLAGPSHVLPTNGSARFASALGVEDFLRRHHVIEFSAEQIAAVAPHIRRLAEAEGLQAHALAAELRLDPGTEVAS